MKSGGQGLAAEGPVGVWDASEMRFSDSAWGFVSPEGAGPYAHPSLTTAWGTTGVRGVGTHCWCPAPGWCPVHGARQGTSTVRGFYASPRPRAATAVRTHTSRRGPTAPALRSPAPMAEWTVTSAVPTQRSVAGLSGRPHAHCPPLRAKGSVSLPSALRTEAETSRRSFRRWGRAGSARPGAGTHWAVDSPEGPTCTRPRCAGHQGG